MAALTNEQIIEAIKEKTILELSDLIKSMEEVFGVTAAAPVAVVAGGAAVLLARDAGFKKACAKIIGAGLKLKDDAAAFVETVKEDAQDIMAEAAYNKDAASAAN